MKKIFVFVLTFLSLSQASFSLEVVYPKNKQVKINAPSTFFIGSVNPNDELNVNDIPVTPSLKGAFAYQVPLQFGLNTFKLTSGSEVVEYVIERVKPPVSTAKVSTLVEYPNVNFVVIKDGTPLRSTPVDSGINRLAHLPIGVKLIVNGEKGNFYRVFLNPEKVGWISKSAVESVQPLEPPKFIKMKTKEDRKICVYEFELTDRVPFSLKEENGLTLELFNLSNSDTPYKVSIPVKKLLGYDVFYEENKLVLKVRKPLCVNEKTPLKNLTITVDAGHGGCEAGAIGGFGDKEKDINLAIANNLKSELESRGAKVVMTREEDVQVSLSQRVDIAREAESDLLLSLHANALPDGGDPLKNRGTSVYYYHNQSKLLAENVLNSMTTQLGTNNDKARQGSLALVRPTFCPSVLIEVAYIINPDDYALLLDKQFQINCAKSIADGIEKYILELKD